MPYDVYLLKPAGQELRDNREWVELVRGRLPQLVPDAMDRTGAAENAEDYGLTVAEYITRGIGVALEGDREDFWMRVSFWEARALLELPNFPEGGPERAVEQALPLIATLTELGFRLEPPDGCDAQVGDPREFMLAGYGHRQGAVTIVAGLTRGRPT